MWKLEMETAYGDFKVMVFDTLNKAIAYIHRTQDAFKYSLEYIERNN